MSERACITIISLLAMMILVSACQSLEFEPLSETPVQTGDGRDYVFAVDSRGRGDNFNGKELCIELDDRSLGKHKALRTKFYCIIKKALKFHSEGLGNFEDELQIVLFFNGGLNRINEIVELANGSYSQMMDEGYFPIFLAWPTGPVSTWWEDVVRVRSGKLSKDMGPSTLITTPFRIAGDLLTGLAETPGAYVTSISEFRRTDLGFGNDTFGFGSQTYSVNLAEVNRHRVAAGGSIDADRNVVFSDQVDDFRRSDGAFTFYDPWVSFPRSAALSPVRVVTTPVAIGMGSTMWRNMLRRTKTSLRQTGEFDDGRTTHPHPRQIDCSDVGAEDGAALRWCFPFGSGGFAIFMQWLQSCMTGAPAVPGADGCPLEKLSKEEMTALRNIRLIIIGHSMGAIVINDILEKFPDLPYKQIVYMAGAASVSDTASAVSPILVQNRGCTTFHSLSLHPMNEAREPTAYGTLLSGSLLVYIDELLEKPATISDRTIGQWRNARVAQHLFPEEARQWTLFRVFDREPRVVANEEKNRRYYAPNPTTHGQFNDKNIPFWRPVFWGLDDGVTFQPPQFAQSGSGNRERTCADHFDERLRAKGDQTALAGWRRHESRRH